MTATGPLAGRRVVVTRAGHQAGALRQALLALGAEVVDAPAIEIAPPDDPGPLDRAARSLSAYDWVAFTSPNAVDALRRTLDGFGEKDWPRGPRIASVGPATSEAVSLAFGGCRVDLESAGESSASGLVRAFDGVVRIGRVLLPLSDRARPELASGLRERGASVDAVVAYRNRPARGLAERLSQATAQGVDLVVLASPSAAEAVAKALGPRARGTPVVVIGETTRAAAHGAGFSVRGVAKMTGPGGLAEAAVAALSPAGGDPPISLTGGH